MPLVLFQEIRLGDGFMVNNMVYMRTDEIRASTLRYNAVDCMGKLHGFEDKAGVKPVFITLHVSPPKTAPKTA